MHTEDIIVDGYTVKIAQDDCAENPFKAWDCEPPLLVYYEGLDSYGEPPDIGDLVRMIPDSNFERGNRVKLIREFLNCSLRSFAESRMYSGESVRDEFAQWCVDTAGDASGWRSANEHFDMLEALAKLAGIPCYQTQSNGYSQGDNSLVIAFATPEWVKKCGVDPEHQMACCKAACKLYGYWAWGDVYGIVSITAPGDDDMEGEELEEGSVWGFYGDDHEESGLLESARNTIECHKAELEKDAAAAVVEAGEAAYWASRDVETV